MQIPAFQLSRPITWHKSRLSHYCELFLALSLEGFAAKRSTPLQSGKSRLFLQNTRGGVSLTAPSGSPCLFTSLILSPLCFTSLTNCLYRMPFVLILLYFSH